MVQRILDVWMVGLDGTREVVLQLTGPIQGRRAGPFIQTWTIGLGNDPLKGLCCGNMNPGMNHGDVPAFKVQIDGRNVLTTSSDPRGYISNEERAIRTELGGKAFQLDKREPQFKMGIEQLQGK